MTHTPKILNRILKKVTENSLSKQQSLVVFDLDSTLFDVSPRLKKILTDFAEQPEHQRRFPGSIELLKTIRTHRNDWGIKDAIIRSGLDSHHPEFLEAVREWWKTHFFSNHYVHFDVPYEGAVDYVNSLHKVGGHIVYLTGRDTQRMGRGSVEVLQKWQFPVNQERAELVLKPMAGMDDAKFKSDWFIQAKRHDYKDLIFFENEPVNVNLVRQEHPDVEIVFFDSTHARKEHPPQDIPWIVHYLSDE